MSVNVSGWMRGALPVVVVLLAAGCSQGGAASDPSSSSTSVAPGAAARTAAGGTKQQQRDALSRKCMEDKGWKGTPQAGGVRYDLKGQEAAFTQASQECERVVQDQIPLPKLTATQIKSLYALEVKTAKCLRDHGLPGPDEPAISEQQYLSEYAKGPSWYAYMNVADVAAAEKVCPQPTLDL